MISTHDQKVNRYGIIPKTLALHASYIKDQWHQKPKNFKYIMVPNIIDFRPLHKNAETPYEAGIFKLGSTQEVLCN